MRCCLARAANPCPALGDDRHILVIFLILGGGGMILKFIISGSCYAQTHAFSAHFLLIFLHDLFFARQASNIGGMYDVSPHPPGICSPVPGVCQCPWLSLPRFHFQKTNEKNFYNCLVLVVERTISYSVKLKNWMQQMNYKKTN